MSISRDSADTSNSYNPAYSLIVDAMMSRLRQILRENWHALLPDYQDAICEKAIRTVRGGTGSHPDIMGSDDDISAVGIEMVNIMISLHHLVYQAAREENPNVAPFHKAVTVKLADAMDRARGSKCRKTRHNIRRVLGMPHEADEAEATLQYEAEARDKARVVNQDTGATVYDYKKWTTKKRDARNFGLASAITASAVEHLGLIQLAMTLTLPGEFHGAGCPVETADVEIRKRLEYIKQNAIRAGIHPVGYYAIEQHEDGTPHIHAALHCRGEDEGRLIAIVNEQFPEEETNKVDDYGNSIFLNRVERTQDLDAWLIYTLEETPGLTKKVGFVGTVRGIRGRWDALFNKEYPDAAGDDTDVPRERVSRIWNMMQDRSRRAEVLFWMAGFCHAPYRHFLDARIARELAAYAAIPDAVAGGSSEDDDSDGEETIEGDSPAAGHQPQEIQISGVGTIKVANRHVHRICQEMRPGGVLVASVVGRDDGVIILEITRHSDGGYAVVDDMGDAIFACAGGMSSSIVIAVGESGMVGLTVLDGAGLSLSGTEWGGIQNIEMGMNGGQGNDLLAIRGDFQSNQENKGKSEKEVSCVEEDRDEREGVPAHVHDPVIPLEIISVDTPPDSIQEPPQPSQPPRDEKPRFKAQVRRHRVILSEVPLRIVINNEPLESQVQPQAAPVQVRRLPNRRNRVIRAG